MPTQLPEDQRSEQGAWLFLISLAVFFVSCILLYAIYVVIRVSPAGEIPNFWLPQSFIYSTLILIGISYCLHHAVVAVRTEKRVDLARYVVIASLLAVTFFAIQGTGMAWMIQELEASPSQDRSLYGFTFVLVLLHALHVIGGAVGLTLVIFGIRREAYDHERYWPIRFCALYWHFLDIVWVLMLIAFAIAAIVSKR